MSKDIEITFDSKTYIYPPGVTPFKISKEHNSEHPKVLVAQSEEKLLPLSTPLFQNTKIKFLTFDDAEGKKVFYHSSAHVLGYAILQIYPNAKLSAGPPTAQGFYYDVLLDKNHTFSTNDYLQIDNKMKEIISKKTPIEQKFFKREDLLEKYKENIFKKHFIDEAIKKCKEDELLSAYCINDFVDLCPGPHILFTNNIKLIKVTNHGSAYFLKTKISLTRIHGVSFPSLQHFDEYNRNIVKAKKRDHRNSDLFFVSRFSPGSPFFTVSGTFTYNSLLNYIREEYKKRGYGEIITPVIYSNELWETSGHLQNYKENMFLLSVNGGDSVSKEVDDANNCGELNGQSDFSNCHNNYALKPMNCPAHCLYFRQTDRSYRDLPLRLADFGVLHRNELSGTLTGLTRVRKFSQDDSHIFCMLQQVEGEIRGVLDFLDCVYSILKFSYDLKLSTRPEKFIGNISDWDEAENMLIRALEGRDYTINEGDGAFYGPKIDIVLYDGYGRQHQCATIQLDFQLPIRFNLKYRSKEGKMESPVMIHRAILGSVERMMAVLIEHFDKLPFWLNYRQTCIISVVKSENVNNMQSESSSSKILSYCDSIKENLSEFHVFVDDSDLSVSKKVLRAETSHYSVICIVGDKEVQEASVNIRGHGMVKLEKLKEILTVMLKRKIELNDAISG
ncbi:threonine--tRNA ligase [Hamiltosporidium tvaerminnensis]|uniref:threonine--tRNA ligase n=1 Tax=Hamiltosporidium tvaerminnensis TaxID=1176355 RepID=A0A4Q9LD94_9MICR|nr:threonyl-tRNA synthetase [Hamiltosporidium tvaerminnensis]TBU04740.1 threonine--tRNA ligase [Hamiltosporidium tvaerminnensis]